MEGPNREYGEGPQRGGYTDTGWDRELKSPSELLKNQVVGDRLPTPCKYLLQGSTESDVIFVDRGP